MIDEFNDWWDKDALTQTNPYSENTPVYWAWEGWLAAKRAIEAECRVPEGWDASRYSYQTIFNAIAAAVQLQGCGIAISVAAFNTAMLAAAPQPEKAEPDCECGAVASEHCPACEPVAQEPFGIWHQGDTEEESDFFLFKDSGDVSCPNCIKLYTAPPDQSAEVSMTPAASIFKDEVARLNAEVERLREILSAQVSQAESQQTVYRNRIAELEATIEAQRTLYANCIKISHEADELEHKCNRLERQQAVLVEALEKLARLGNGEHYGNSEGNCIAIAALASVKGNAVADSRPD
jgi:uncharacterized Zn finger protein (UPF0148 family)